MNLYHRLKYGILERLGHPVAWNDLARRYPQYEIGIGSYGGLEIPYSPGQAKLRVGAWCSIGADVQVMLGSEHRPDWTSMFPFNVECPEFTHMTGHPRSKGDVAIGSDVWIGREAMILSGITIGDGAVIGARAVVTRDVPPYGIVAGNPAKLIRKRFDDALIERLLRIRWWDWPEKRVKAAVPLIMSTDVLRFVEAAEHGEI